jgi:hypothetical protein
MDEKLDRTPPWNIWKRLCLAGAAAWLLPGLLFIVTVPFFPPVALMVGVPQEQWSRSDRILSWLAIALFVVRDIGMLCAIVGAFGWIVKRWRTS